MLRSLPFITALFLITAAFCFRSALRNDEALTVVFYNVENLFDTLDTPDVKDEEFTPEGKYQWTAARYYKKLTDLAKVLSEASGQGLSSVIGICEVENRAVVEDLLGTGRLASVGYKLVHKDSPDERGIDVAFAYDPKQLTELHHESIFVKLETDTLKLTRDILYVKTLSGKDTIHFFVNHWPSRSGGQEASEPKRISAARVLKQRVDSIMTGNSEAKIIIMGDFNDHPNDRTMTEVLQSVPGTGARLVNLAYHMHASGKGTYNYKGEWGMLDQFIVSDRLLKSGTGLVATDTAMMVFSPEWLLFSDAKTGVTSPSRTYGGANYYGGYSDHLPIVLHLHHVGKK